MNSYSAKPQSGEYAPYFDRYVSLVSANDILGAFDQQRRDMVLLLSGREESDGNLRYAAGKWSVKEVLGHICDAERIFAYRALRISRGDATPLASFEQNGYVTNGPFANLALSDMVEEFIAARRATVSLFRNLAEAAWERKGVASDNPVSVRALAWIIAGHELHHRRILEQKYFSQVAAPATGH